MAAFFTFDIVPSTTIRFTAPYPDPSISTASLAITTPDSVVITISDLVTVAGFDVDNPGALVDVTVTELNAADSSDVSIVKGTDTLTALPWTKFPPGRYQVAYTAGSDSLSKEFLLFTTIEDCLYTKIDGYMYKTCCDSCNGTEVKRLVEKLIAVKEGARLDFKYAAWADLTAKLTALEHLCEDDFCTCDCGC